MVLKIWSIQPTKQELLKTLSVSLSVSPWDDFLCQLLQSTYQLAMVRSGDQIPQTKSSPKCNVNYWEAPCEKLQPPSRKNVCGIEFSAAA
jgi:hypothetical protein